MVDPIYASMGVSTNLRQIAINIGDVAYKLSRIMEILSKDGSLDEEERVRIRNIIEHTTGNLQFSATRLEAISFIARELEYEPVRS